MSRFNLIDEKWIPVRFPDGSRDELGIRDTLLRSGGIAAIEDSSPLVVATLHRFLLAVLYRALKGPTDIEQAKSLFKEGLPGEKISAYLEKWRDRFWLFDEKYPFGQIPTFKPKSWRAWTALASEHNADNAKVLFDHVDVTKYGSINPSAAARWLLATQTFAVSAGKSEISHTGTAPSAGSVMAIPIGTNLLDTLLFCLVPQNRMVMQDDIPSWEKEPESLEYLKTPCKVSDKKTGKEKDRAIERCSSGIVDLFTWRTRSIIFKESPSGGISELGFASGIGYAESTELDPMLGYTIVEIMDAGTKEKVKKRVTIHLGEKGFWRDFDSLLPDDAHLAPKVIEHAIALTKTDRKRLPKGVMILGQRYFPPRPNIAFWRNEHFALPEAIAGNRYIRHDIRDILIEAEKAGKALWNGEDGIKACLSSSIGVFAKTLLSRGERDVLLADIKCFAQSVNAVPWYWSTLESHFHEILREYTLDRDFEDIRYQWLKSVQDTLRAAWKQHSASVSTGDVWSIRALVKAEGPVLRKLKELNDEILKLEPRKEDV
ncbi:MAG: type I-E CRISPR-associated protein Cse1/CasA [Syntrophobacterales bacterium CG_4_8_14_3_um_filter_49_14]|nr:MAG: type I-E CRISPR-associated protein Cse1/CasA [Syntrophobacterales bacterium CG_4_8_14_3_um_filter_49_14]